MKKVLIVVGTRPNFVKVTQFKNVTAHLDGPEVIIVHTGQHYDDRMSNVFFEQFELEPDHFLDIPQAAPNTQMAEIMLRLEKVVTEVKPDLIMVVGDVNSTFAAALTANKMGIKIAHLESGLRSFYRDMPEEINRILTDEIADLLFVTEQSGLNNLENEGKPETRVRFVGNTMIDTMVAFEDRIQASPIMDELGLQKGDFVLMTIHRPRTVDNAAGLNQLVTLLDAVTEKYPIVFPIHPRTVKNLETHDLLDRVKGNERVTLTEPMDYFAFQRLIAECKLILTDSGGIQEESTFRQVPCLTLRPSTERPSTVDLGTNELVPWEVSAIMERVVAIENGTFKKGEIPPLWDGKATERIIEILKQEL